MANPNDVDWTTDARFGKALKEARTRLGLTKGGLAQRAKVDREFVRQFEAGRFSDDLLASTVLDVTDALGLRIVFRPPQEKKKN